VVLRGRPDHGRAADVDLLERLAQGDLAPCHGLHERIEVAGDHVDRLDIVRSHVGAVLLVTATI
jgi:hypothetical protein